MTQKNSIRLTWALVLGSALALGFGTLLIPHQPFAQNAKALDIVSGPCCSGPYFDGTIIRELVEEMGSEPLDVQAAWLMERLRGVPMDHVLALSVGLAGACAVECSESLMTARAMVDGVLDERIRADEQAIKWVEIFSQWVAPLLCLFIGWAAHGFFNRTRGPSGDRAGSRPRLQSRWRVDGSAARRRRRAPSKTSPSA